MASRLSPIIIIAVAEQQELFIQKENFPGTHLHWKCRKRPRLHISVGFEELKQNESK